MSLDLYLFYWGSLIPNVIEMVDLVVLSCSAGTYFAKHASLSSQYCKNSSKHSMTLGLHGVNPFFCSSFTNKSMFLARVIVGDYTTGNKTYIRPPSKDGSLINLYDSCVDNPFSPLLYVIFDSNQIYPEYIIQFD